MGTNFAFLEHFNQSIGSGEEIRHIGKRSAAGRYCWDCETTLCRSGQRGIHRSTSEWYDNCPECGQSQQSSPLEEDGNPAGLELGFASTNESKPSGVKGASSFLWSGEPQRVKQICEQNLEEDIIRDEYGRTLTGGEFLEMLENQCPIEHRHSIGQRFS